MIHWILGLALAQTLVVVPTFNAGARLTCGESTVFIDTFFKGPGRHYRIPTAAELEALARTPGDHLILVTHLHWDHADLDVLRAHLRANIRASLAATAQIAGPLAAQFPKQVTVIPRGGRHRWKDVSVELYDVPHGGNWPDLENSAHRIGLCGEWVFHPADAEPDMARLERSGWKRPRVDVALLPFWYLTGEEGRPYVQALGSPREIWAIHGDIGNPAWRQQVKATWPQAKGY